MGGNTGIEPCAEGVPENPTRIGFARGPFSGHFGVSPQPGRNLMFPAMPWIHPILPGIHGDAGPASARSAGELSAFRLEYQALHWSSSVLLPSSGRKTDLTSYVRPESCRLAETSRNSMSRSSRTACFPSHDREGVATGVPAQCRSNRAQGRSCRIAAWAIGEPRCAAPVV